MPQRRVFRAGLIQFDEARMELLVDGQRRPIEAKPLALLHALLLRAGAVVTKRALIEAAWGNADHVSEASLTTGISKLRASLGEKGRDLIDAVPGIGYRITVAVEVAAARDALAFGFQAGAMVPGRPQWRLEQPLGAGGLNDVWLARHGKSGEVRVFKFADSEARLEALRREATLSRVLHATLGPRSDLVRVLKWNFDTRPYFIESPYGGLDLPAWAALQGGLVALSLHQRLAMLACIARTIAAAHAAGVLHSDIKPANILVQHEPDGPVQLRLVDFGAGGLSDPAQFAALAITAHCFSSEGGENGTDTLRYMAPEVLAGGAPTTAADIYALGVLLYQFVTGDLTKPLAVGWEEDVIDDLLRADIASAASGDPARRLQSAADLADRIETLPARRARQQVRTAEAAASALLARQMERAQARRPWAIAAALSMAAGLTLSTLFGIRALHDRDETRKRAAVTQAVNNFLTEDLLGRGNPAQSGKADETLMGAAEAAEAGIDRRLGEDPMEAGAIYLSLARAFDSRTAYDAARRAYDHAIADFKKAGAQGRADAVIAQIHEAMMETMSGQPGSTPRAKAEIAEIQAEIPTLGARRDEALVWLDASRAMLQMFGGDVRIAQAGFKQAADQAETMPEVFDESSTLALRQNEAFTYFRLGEWARAEALIGALLHRRMALNGPLHTATLQLQLNLDQVRIATGGSAAALPDLDRIYPHFIAVFGPDHVRTLTLLATRAEAQRRLEHYDDAIADGLTIYRLAAAKFGDRSFLAVGELGDLANSRCRGGHEAAGLQTAQLAYAGGRTNFGAGSVVTQMLGSDLALCLIVNGQFAAAIPLLSHINRQAVAELTVDPEYGAELDLMRAAAALGVGDKSTGVALLTKVMPAFQQPNSDAYMRHLATRLWTGIASISTAKK